MFLKLNETKKLKQKQSSSFELWKSQINSKTNDELINYYYEIIKNIKTFNSNNNDIFIQTDKYQDLLNKLDYIENKLGIHNKLGRELH